MVDVGPAPIRILGNPSPEEIAAVVSALLTLLNSTTAPTPQAACWCRRRQWELNVADRTARHPGT
jgi:acyl-CoA carboxylase epsilon subunit-like protein